MPTTRLASLLLLGLLACGGNAAPGETTTDGTPTITTEQIAASGAATAWDVVERLHRRWFRDQLTGKEVSVYEDTRRLGGADALRDFASRDVAELQYFSGQTAVRRWGPGVEGGVIVVVRNRS
jgi:hypothetical protein